MRSSKIMHAPRIPPLRPLRPPNTIRNSPRLRPFTQRSQLLLVAPHTPRPQLPYLSQPILRQAIGPSHQLARLLSTENKHYFREQVYLAGKWTIIGWTFLVLGITCFVGITIEREERANATPSEWRFFTRQALRGARANLSVVQKGGAGFVDWAKVGTDMGNCLARLEDLEKDGKGLTEPADGEQILIPDIGKAGFDISAKSYEWRTGYYEVIMGCAAAAEHLDGMVLDQTRNIVFPSEVVIGPSNSDPRPVPPYMAAAPLEENCVAPYEKPETFYMRVLTGKGFTTTQRLNAALGYANWLEYKNLLESATEMYRWGVDIAASALAIPADAVLDHRTSVIKEESSAEATSNLLRAATALAIHHARTADLSSALPILLSVLRARHTAPISPFPPTPSASGTEVQPTDIAQFAQTIRKIFRAPTFPAPPPSGDTPIVRESERATCEDSELMLYIGEILFATAPESKEGIAWTREGVGIAEQNLGTRGGSGEEARKCKECLITGVGNWEIMLRRMSELRDAVREREGARSAGWMEFGGWFGGNGGGVKGKTLDAVAGGVLEAELGRVEGLKERIAREGIEEEMLRARGTGAGNAVWMGG